MSLPARISETLAQHGLRATPIRRQVLHVLLSKAYALSSNDIEQVLGAAGIDRITLYRTLRAFEPSFTASSTLRTSSATPPAPPNAPSTRTTTTTFISSVRPASTPTASTR